MYKVVAQLSFVVRLDHRLTEHDGEDAVGLGSLIEVCSQQCGSKICISTIGEESGS